ncbi:MAG: endonuclease/exonuclease/phosphatase family protein, partial [Myxococcaceae bacterium]|nr:endonuclease/exonuclease/phosphatase family protein [Myxococcaceae bacterium]
TRPAAPAEAPALPPPSTHGAAPRFTFVSWNVKDLFDAVDDPATSDKVRTPDEVSAKLASLAAVLGPLDAGVCAIQEVENRQTLEALGRAADPAHFDASRCVFFPGGPDGRGQGLLSRYPVTKVVNHADDALHFASGENPFPGFRSRIGEVHLEVAGRPMVVLQAHLLFNGAGPAAPEYRRAQGERLAAIAQALRAEDPSRPVLVAGDFNDEPGAGSLEALRPAGFTDAFGELPTAARTTNVLKGRERIIDHVQATPGLGVVPGSARVVGGDDVKGVSDHRVLAVELAFDGDVVDW